jgi:alanine-glyoxylate transaminase/serine-glyoxylate transaminase/serine-pyruvate transaminase
LLHFSAAPSNDFLGEKPVDSETRPFVPPDRLLLGPGPSNVHARVYHALSRSLVGHLDPEFLRLMNELQEMLRQVFQTTNEFTIAVSGTGSAGMEAALVNIVEPGDRVVVCIAGVFGNRMADIVERCGAELIRVDQQWGRAVDLAQVEVALKNAGPVKAVAIVHAETSTGVQQPLDGLGELCHRHDALLIVDAVTSLGGLPVEVDRRQIDVCYSGTQKCLSCPPGLAPITFSDRAVAAFQKRKSKVQSWYLDMNLIADYWSDKSRAYHHTAPISMNYALHEALRLVLEEGLPARFQRHQKNHEALLAGLAALGLEPVPPEGQRLPMLNAVTIPDGVDDKLVRGELLHEYGIEIGGGLGAFAGKVWRIGLMGESSRRHHVIRLLAALEEIFNRHGWRSDSAMGDAVAAAMEAYAG